MPRSWSLDHVGPLARTVADAAAMTRAIAGVNEGDATAWIENVPDYVSLLDDAPQKLRIGMPVSKFLEEASPVVEAVFEEAFKCLTSLGHELVDVELPDATRLSQLNELVTKAEAATIHRQWLIECPEKYGSHVRSRIEAGLAIPASRYLEAQSTRKNLCEAFVTRVFDQCDVVCTPTVPFGAPSREETNPESPNGVIDLVRKMTYRTRPFNYLGLPAFNIPIGFDANNMPLGLQVIGPPLAETRLFQLGHQYQQHTDWHKLSPSLKTL